MLFNDGLYLSGGHLAQHGLAASGTVHGQRFARHRVGDNAAAGIDALQIKASAPDMRGEINDLSGSYLQIFHNGDGVLDHRGSYVGAVAQLHNLISQTIGQTVPDLHEEAGVLQRPELIEQGALWHIQQAADLSQCQFGLGRCKTVQNF